MATENITRKSRVENFWLAPSVVSATNLSGQEMRELFMKHWKWMLLAPVFAVGLGYVVLFSLQAQAMATILYTLPKGYTLSSDIDDGDPFTYLKILESKWLRSSVEKSYSDHERSVLAKKSWLSKFVPSDDLVRVKMRGEGANIYFDITVRQSTYAAAALVADRYATKFLGEVRQYFGENNAGALDYLRARRRELTKELENATGRLAQSRAENDAAKIQETELEVNSVGEKLRKLQERLLVEERPHKAPFRQVVFATRQFAQ